MKKRLVSLLAALAILFTLMPAGAVAAFAELQDNIYTSEDGCFKFSVLDGNATIEACVVTKDKLEELGNIVTIPEMITAKEDGKSYPVIAIGDCAFSPFNDYYNTGDCTEIQEIKVDAKLTRIGENAFWECSSLNKVNIPETVTEMESSVFMDCTSLEEIKLLDTMKKVPDAIFSGCSSLTSVTLPKNAVEIGAGAFEDCSSLETVQIPDTVKSIGSSAFARCEELSEIKLPENLESIGGGAFEGCLELTEFEIPKTVTSIGNGAFSGCEGLTALELPEGITAIGNDTFSGCISLTNIVVPESVISIGKNAFGGCSELKSVTLPSNLKEIEYETFKNCTQLESINIPGTVNKIGYEAFLDCNALKKVAYTGTEKQWSDLLENQTEYGNDALKSETVTVTCTGKPEEPDKPTPKPTPAPAEPADDSPDVLGTTALVVAGGLGVAAAGYAAYRVGTELYLNQVLPAGAEIPVTRAQLAELVWTDAGKPEPAAPLAEDAPEDMKALNWAVESGLMQAAKKNGEDYAAEDAVSRITVIRTWNKAQELKKAAA